MFEWILNGGTLGGGGVMDTFVLPASLYQSRVALLDGRLHLTGGRFLQTGAVTNGHYVYENDTWVPRQSLPNIRWIHSLDVLDNQLWLFGGLATGLEPGRVNTLHRYDPTTDTWVARATGPSARYAHRTVVHDNLLYLFGGRTTVELRDFYRYDPTANVWTTLPLGPSMRRYHAMATLGGEIYVYGGQATNDYLGDFWRYSIAGNSWEQLPTPSFLPRTGSTLTAIGDSLYLFGGRLSNGTIVQDLLRYYPPTGVWSTANAIVPNARYFHESLSVGSELLTVGGLDDMGGVLTDVTTFSI